MALPLCTTLAPQRVRPLMTRKTAFSLPGISEEARMTVSPSTIADLVVAVGHPGQRRHRLALRAGADQHDLLVGQVVERP